ncbi:UNVERIFIED_CONTAM: hypothetical protein RMT77_009550 [Armadillidium vulgare]
MFRSKVRVLIFILFFEFSVCEVTDELHEHRNDDLDFSNKNRHHCSNEVKLSASSKRLVGIYETALRESEIFRSSPDHDQELMLKDLQRLERILKKPVEELKEPEEKELKEWADELDSLSRDSLKRTFKAMFKRNIYLYNPNAVSGS